MLRYRGVKTVDYEWEYYPRKIDRIWLVSGPDWGHSSILAYAVGSSKTILILCSNLAEKEILREKKTSSFFDQVYLESDCVSSSISSLLFLKERKGL